MSMQWTIFNGKEFGRRRKDDVRVTLGPKGNIHLNGKAFDALGSPAAVELSFEGNRRLIGLRRTDLAKANAFRVKPHTGNYKMIHAAAFCQHFRIRPRETILFQNVDVDHGLMTLDLANTVTVSRGAR